MATKTRKRPVVIEISSDSDESDIATPRYDENDGNCATKTKRRRVFVQTKNQTDNSNNQFKINSCASSSQSQEKTWQIHELLATNENIDQRSAKNVVKLFEDDNTIPFIYRYRRDMINNTITPEKLRDLKRSYEEILNLKKRTQKILTQLETTLTNETRNEILSAKTFEELEFLCAPYKSANKGTLADRAKALGLDIPAEHILYGKSPEIRLENLINKSNSEMDTIEKIFNGICNIISHIISKSTEVLEELKKLQKTSHIVLKSSNVKSSKGNKENEKKQKQQQKNDECKYEHYFNFEIPIKYIKPHQILAINRGENLKYLNVKITIPDKFKYDIKYFIKKLFLSKGIHYQIRTEIFEKTFDECYGKKLQPFVIRQIRSELNSIAKKASIDVFAKNLKQLLLISPLKGQKILGIDPGFSNGCKLALISETADVLETNVIYPHSSFTNSDESAEKLIKMLTKHNCNIIALGNGKACRETEFWLTGLFERDYLDASKIKYSIVSEQGASVYSCSEIAKKEFPNMDVNLISAVSIARRLNDPLSEYVKIEPRHIGVGMYQHDINEKALNESLNDVVTECVSFVGVDINTASLSVLQYIAGLSTTRAKNLIAYRIKNGPFKTRKDLLKVKGIGEKTFTQCAGFIRVEPLSVPGANINLLDCTWIHPESYDIAEKIIKKCKLNVQNIGQEEFIETIRTYSLNNSLDQLENEFKIPKERIVIVLEALQRKLLKDYRSDINKKPLFKQGITKMTELKNNTILSGAVTNLTHFGAFIDIGVEKDGLIHASNMKEIILSIGDRIEVKVLSVNLQKGHIQLKFENFSI